MRTTTAAICTALALAVPPNAAAERGTPGGRDRPAQHAADRGPMHALVVRALDQVGVPYRWGGESPDTGFDCSGLVMYLFDEVFGRALPRTARGMSRFGRNVRRSELAAGDLVFFNTRRRPFSHVGIYIGNGRFIHAPARGRHVTIESFSDGYWQRRYDGARRIRL